MFLIILDGSNLIHRNPNFIKSLTQPLGICINNLANQYLISYGDYLCLHTIILNKVDKDTEVPYIKCNRLK